LAVTERRGLFKSWTLLLAIAAFSLSLLGTFLVRSGILVSVHAFATDPTRGFFILAFLGVVILSALALYAWRAPGLDSDAGFAPLSRETFLLLNNVLLVIAALLVFIGTLAPLVVEVMNAGKISVGAPWFEVAFAIPMIPLVFLLGLGMHTAWRSQAKAPWVRLLRIPVIVAVVVGAVMPFLFWGGSGLLVTIGMIAGVWIIATSLIQPLRSWRGGVRMTPAVLGMSLAHLGVGLFVIGVATVQTFSIETDRALSPGQSVDIGKYTYEMRELRDVEGPNYFAREAVVEIRRNGDFVAEVRPQKRQYLVQKSPMTEAGIDAALTRDLFVALGDQIGTDTWSVRIQYKPMIRFIWLGCLVMALGGLVAASDRRYRMVAHAADKAGKAATEAA
jgi:cytochrome c-type biogenesis protein CcmF